MSLIVLDTETTGLKVSEGHRVIEIGCIELVDRRPSGRRLHVLINPEREVDEGAARVHGMTWASLQDKPKFAQVSEDFIRFVEGHELVIHNASFDMEFLEAEFARLGLPSLRSMVRGVIDSLMLARELHPGQRNSLDALCARYGINNEHRVLHGALLDAELLAEVYLNMTRGQETLDMLGDSEESLSSLPQINLSQLGLKVLAPSPEELALHEANLDAIDKACKQGSVWRRGA